MAMGNTGKDNMRVGKPENYCGSYPFKKQSTLDRKKGKIAAMTILIDVKEKIFFFGKIIHIGFLILNGKNIVLICHETKYNLL